MEVQLGHWPWLSKIQSIELRTVSEMRLLSKCWLLHLLLLYCFVLWGRMTGIKGGEWWARYIESVNVSVSASWLLLVGVPSHRLSSLLPVSGNSISMTSTVDSGYAWTAVCHWLTTMRLTQMYKWKEILEKDKANFLREFTGTTSYGLVRFQWDSIPKNHSCLITPS
jgi:hypothetical protein